MLLATTARLSQRHSYVRRAAIGISHRVGVRTGPLLEVARACVRPSTAGGLTCHRSRAAKTEDRAMSVAGHHRARLSQRTVMSDVQPLASVTV